MSKPGDRVRFRHLGDDLEGVVDEVWHAHGQPAYRLALDDGTKVCASEYAVSYAERKGSLLSTSG